MLKTNFFLNPKRLDDSLKLNFKSRIIFKLKEKLLWIGIYLGFNNVNYSYVHGEKNRLKLGKNCSTMNSIFNVISGEIYIGNDTIFGHNCMVLTGTHNFTNGVRVSLDGSSIEDETPKLGRDIIIGTGCFIGSGVTIIGPVEIGNNVVIGAGSVVTKSLPSRSFCAGIPAKLIKEI
tara:strand:+ start:120 stop:647 length:528 start_codon:yes stop_codon:yes gene_type:complete